jgi:hypothetical protein
MLFLAFRGERGLFVNLDAAPWCPGYFGEPTASQVTLGLDGDSFIYCVILISRQVNSAVAFNFVPARLPSL